MRRSPDRLHVWFPKVQASPLSGFEHRRVTDKANDLALLLSLGQLLPGNRLTLVPRLPRRARWLAAEAPLPVDSQGVVVTEVDDPSLPRGHVSGLVRRAAPTFLSEHFARIVYTWQFIFDPALIEREHPVVVLHEMVERVLLEKLPDDPMEVMEASVRGADASVTQRPMDRESATTR